MVTEKIEMNICENNNVSVFANKGEINTRNIEVSFVDNEDNPLDLTGKNVIIYAEKPDKNVIFNDCVIVGDPLDGKIVIEITEQMLALEGIVNCEFHVIQDNSLVLKVIGLKIISNYSIFSENHIESSSEYQTLLNALERTSEALNQAETLVELLNPNFGTWTPTLIPSSESDTVATYSTLYKYGIYYRIGQICNISLSWAMQISDPGTGNIRIGGLPYISAESSVINKQFLLRGEGMGLESSPSGPAIIKSAKNYMEILNRNDINLNSFQNSNYVTLSYSGWYVINSIYN